MNKGGNSGASGATTHRIGWATSAGPVDLTGVFQFARSPAEAPVVRRPG